METLKTILKTIFFGFILPILAMTMLITISEEIAFHIMLASPLIVFISSYFFFRYFSDKENEKNNQSKV
ncbi:MAG: hypothetical protein V1698_02435 [bacterium]